MSLKIFIFILTTSMYSYALKLNISSKPELKINKMIIGGNEAPRDEFLYKCAIYITKITEKLNFCSRSIISDRFVISAAHCFSNMDSGVLFAGVHNLEEEETPYDWDFLATDVILHEEYDAVAFLNDIALINVTANPFSFNMDSIQNIQIATESIINDKSLVGMIGRIAGWGQTTDENREISSALLYIDAQIIDINFCRNIFGSKVTTNNICLSGNNGRSTCQGDSGGGLQVTFDDETYIIAIVSFGAEAGCEKNYPIVFTLIAPYLKWINSIVKKD